MATAPATPPTTATAPATTSGAAAPVTAAPGATPPVAVAVVGSAAPAGSRAGRLPSGELRRQVARYLADHPGVEFTAGEIARGLSGRSSGAVANALALLAGRGQAQQTTTKPLRYRDTPTTGNAATPPAAPTTTTAPSRASGPAAARRRPRTATTSTPTSTPAGAAPVTDATEAEPVVSGPVTRPNGQAYHPRDLSGLPDVTALRRLRAAGVAALFYGPPGTGKTSVVEAAFPDLITVQGDGDTTVADFVGEYTQTPDGRYVFLDGPLVNAMREGRALFIDDATLIPPTVLAVVYPAMDGRRQITVKANAGAVIDAAPGFYVVAGHNPGVHGAVLSDALSSRFSMQVQVSTDYQLAGQLGVDPRAVRVARNLATRRDKGEISWAPQLRELLAFQKITGVLGAATAAGNLIGVAPEEDREVVAAVVRSVFGSTIAPLALGARI